MNQADIAIILEKLRTEVRARRRARSGDSENAPYNALVRQLQRCGEQLEITRVVSAHWPLEGRTLPERGLVFVHKVVRRFLRWYINPIVEQQNAFNDTTARTLRLLIEAYVELLRSENQELKTESQGLRSENQESGTGNPEPGTENRAFEALQALVEERGRAEPPAIFPDIELRPLLTRLLQRQQVLAHWPLEEHTLPQKLAAFVHKVTRFYLRWLINPIVEQQNAFNAAVATAVAPLLAADAEVRVMVAAQRAWQKAASRDRSPGVSTSDA